MAEITIAEDLTGAGVGGNDPFSEFGEFGDEFGGGMEDIEKARKAVTFEEEKDRTDRDSLQVCSLSGILVYWMGNIGRVYAVFA